MSQPADDAAAIERAARLPTGSGERFSGYGVMGVPFRSGHILALRRFPASSIGPGYRSVWHRSPDGRWTFYQDLAADLACTRYFGAQVDDVHEGRIDIHWTGPRSLDVSAGDGHLTWTVELASTPMTDAFNRAAALLPDRAWRSRRVLSALARVAGPALQAGQVRLTGLAPNGQRFFANPLRVWLVRDSSARVDGTDFGPLGPAPEQVTLRDFAIPQRGIFVVGRAVFETIPA